GLGRAPAPHPSTGARPSPLVRRMLPTDWRFPAPSATVRMPVPVPVAARGMMPYTYEIVPTHFRRPHWARMVRLLAARPRLIHHAVVYIRRPGSPWLAGAPVGRPFTAHSLRRERDRRDAEWTDSPLLLVDGPGTQPLRFPASMGIYIPAHADLVFQLHLMPDGAPATERVRVEMVFTRHPARRRVLILQLTQDRFAIPPHAADYRVEVHGFLPHAALLLGFFPHMHLRGRRFVYNWVHRDGQVQRLLAVRWRFDRQLNYFLRRPIPLARGAELQAIAWYNNSASNPLNPDPNVTVRWGDQDTGEMMIGFFFVAVPPRMTKWDFFLPPGAHPPRGIMPMPLPLPAHSQAGRAARTGVPSAQRSALG
ncbi:MAG: hypothetical protein ACRD2F_00995, partial [Terriglobales bacterium]